MIGAYMNLMAAMVIVGSSVVVGKVLIEELPIYFSSALRFLLAVLILVPLLYYKEGGFPRLCRKSLCVLVLQALCGSFLFTIFLLYGLEYIPSSFAGIITSTTPAFMGILGCVFLKEKMTRWKMGGIFFSLMGILILKMNSTGGSSAGGNDLDLLIGFLLVLAAVVVESLFLFMRKWIVEPISSLSMTTLISIFGLMWFLPAGLYEFASINLVEVGIRGWGAVVYYGVFVTVLAYLFWFGGIVHVPASTAGVFTAIMPLSAVLLSVWILNEPLTWNIIMGCSCVLFGISFISLSPKEGMEPERRVQDN
ncbi:MAG: DMT family transporter [Desulfovibrio sp.]